MKLAASIAGLTAALVCAPAAQAAPAITMSGSSVAQALIADLAYFYGHTVRDAPRFSLVGGGTATGIADAERGVVNAGMVSRNLVATDPPGLVLTPIALSGVCLVTNRSNPVPGITRAQVQDIVAGRTTSWAQIPGSTRTDAIVPVALDLTAGARLVFEAVFVDLATPVAYTPRTFAVAAQVRDFVERTPAAFGYVDLALAGRLHTLAYEGVGCTRATVRTGRYPAQRPLGIVTRGKPAGALKRFLHWVTTSRRARGVIATRYVLVARQRGGQLSLDVDVRVVRDVDDDLDDPAAGELEPRLVLRADGVAAVVAHAQPFAAQAVARRDPADLRLGRP